VEEDVMGKEMRGERDGDQTIDEGSARPAEKYPPPPPPHPPAPVQSNISPENIVQKAEMSRLDQISKVQDTIVCRYSTT